MELVASARKYKDRVDLVEWLRGFPTRYTPEQLKSILDRARDKSLMLWSLEDVVHIGRKRKETYLKAGVTIL